MKCGTWEVPCNEMHSVREMCKGKEVNSNYNFILRKIYFANASGTGVIIPTAKFYTIFTKKICLTAFSLCTSEKINLQNTNFFRSLVSTFTIAAVAAMIRPKKEMCAFKREMKKMKVK